MIERLQKTEFNTVKKKKKDIMRADGVEERLVNSLENLLENYLGRLNQHTAVLIKEEISEQHTEMFPEERKALRPYGFYFNNCFVNVGFVADVGENLTQLDSQIKEKEENSVEIFNPWNKEIKLLEIMLKNQDSIQEEKELEEVQNVKVQELEDISNKLKQRDEDSIKGHTMYQSNELLKKRDKQIIISDNLEEVSN